MDQIPNNKHKINFLLSETQSAANRKLNVCNECNRKRKFFDESHRVCINCYRAKTIYKLSGNKVIDDFIRYTLISNNKLKGKMEFVPFEQFKNVEFIAEGGFSKVYKAIWIDGPIYCWNKEKSSYTRTKTKQNYPVVLKRLNNSKNITSKELNELKIFYEFSLNWKKGNRGNSEKSYNYFNYISKYFGITLDPVTKDIMIIMPYYKSGDLINYKLLIFIILAG
ncbi:hypothetical protein C1646_663140 [Rhizophagus diaphanus]|nr:hypothetical protein C1646_663140 [Rhizophagus diaphanus] [Rhizophagus sp. MUCL 43196]